MRSLTFFRRENRYLLGNGLNEFRRDLARWIILQGKSEETARLYVTRIVGWLSGDMGSLEYIEAPEISRSEKKIRRAALSLLANYEGYEIDRPLVLPQQVDAEGEYRPMLEAFEQWMAGRNIVAKVRHRYRMHALHALRQGDNWRRWVNASETRSVKVARIVSLKRFRHFLRIYRCDYGNELPDRFQGMPQSKTPQRKPPVYLSREEAYEIGRAIGLRCGKQAYAIWAVVYGCGLRCSEALNLNLDEVVLGDVPHVRVINGKNGKSRAVPIPSQTVGAILDYLQHERPNLVSVKSGQRLFLSQTGSVVAHGTLRAKLREVYEDFGVTAHQPLHMWRWLFATHLAEQMREQFGYPDWQAIKTLMGHKSIVTTQLYVGEIALNRLGEIVEGVHPLSKFMELAEQRRERQAQLKVSEPVPSRPLTALDVVKSS